MKKREPLAVFFLPIITLGIYSLIWYVSTKEEMKSRGAEIPTAWLLILPIVNIFWLWSYAKGVNTVTGGVKSTGAAFAWLFFLGCIGMAVIQSSFNNIN